jgi:hypothetical protein
MLYPTFHSGWVMVSFLIALGSLITPSLFLNIVSSGPMGAMNVQSSMEPSILVTQSVTIASSQGACQCVPNMQVMYIYLLRTAWTGQMVAIINVMFKWPEHNMFQVSAEPHSWDQSTTHLAVHVPMETVLQEAIVSDADSAPLPPSNILSVSPSSRRMLLFTTVWVTPIIT